MAESTLMPTVQDEDAQFWDKIARKYSKRVIPDQESYEFKLLKTRDYLTPAMNVMEIGCGTGSTALAHAPFVKRIVATDISSKMIDIARQKATEQGIENVEFAVGGVDQISPSEPVDAV